MKQSVRGYHYTCGAAYKSICTPGRDDWNHEKYKDFAGLIPAKAFIAPQMWGDLPKAARAPVFEGLLEPEPISWTHHPKYIDVWMDLMSDICRDDHLVLLSFEMNPNDKAYVVDFAHLSREKYRHMYEPGTFSFENLREGARKFWESAIHVCDYEGGYEQPQLAVFSGIPIERIDLEWITSKDNFWCDAQETRNSKFPSDQIGATRYAKKPLTAAEFKEIFNI